MPSQAVREVVRTTVPRLLDRVRNSSSVLIHAPQEYAPDVAASELMAALHGADGFDTIRATRAEVSEHPERLEAEVTFGRPVLVEVGACDDLSPEVARELVELASRGDSETRLAVVCACDDAPSALLDGHPFGAVIDPDALVLRDREAAEAVPGASDSIETLHTVLHVTGAVPGLVAAFGEGRPDERAATRRLACGWAQRVYDRIVTDPLLSVYLWVGRLSDDSVRVLTEAVAGVQLTQGDLWDAQSQSFITITSQHDPCLPDLLAYELRRLQLQRDPDAATRLRTGLRDAARGNDELSVLERVRLFTTLGEWGLLDEMLAENLRLICLLGETHRRMYATVWPHEARTRWPHLHHALRFVTGEWREGASPDGPAFWDEMAFLLRGEAGREPSRVRDLFRLWMPRVGRRGRSYDAQTARHDVHELVQMLAPEVQRISRSAPADDAAVVAALAIAVADSSLIVGDVASSELCVRWAERCCQVLGGVADQYSALWPAVLARQALLAAKANMHAVGSARLQQYRRATAHIGSLDPASEWFAEIAERFVSASRDRHFTVRPVDPDAPLAPLWAEAEATHALLMHGVDGGLSWMRMLMSRTSWSDRPSWEWWPVHSLAALAEARVGRVGMAESWLERGALPDMLQLVVRAHIQLAAGRPDAAGELADQVLAMHDVPNRWRMLALGAKYGCLPEGAPEWEQVERLAGAENWGRELYFLVVMPENVIAHVLAAVGDADLPPGLRLAAKRPQRSKDVKLTPRQLDVLKALASDKTLAEIAGELYLGQETVRTTAKQMYRRLGVHDRSAAVAMGRALGLL